MENLKEFHISDAEVMGDLKALMGEIQREEGRDDRPPSYDSLQESLPVSYVDTTSENSLKEKEKRLVMLKQKALALKKCGEMKKCKDLIRNQIKPLKAEIESLEAKDVIPSEEENVLLKEENVSVTEEDMQDPELLAQLKAMGYSSEEEECSEEPGNLADQIKVKEKELVEAKRKALALKKAKRMEECVQMIRDIVKPLKAEIEALKSELKLKEQGETNNDIEEEEVTVTEEDMNDPELLAQLNAMNDDSEKPEKKPKNLTEQIEIKEKELVEAKRKALALKKAKRMEECVQMIRDIVKPLKAEIELLKSKASENENTEVMMSPAERRLHTFYKYWEPSRLKDKGFVKRTIKRYENKLPQLIADLGKKYGPEPSEIVSTLKEREADYLKEAMSLRKSGDKKECQSALAEADKLRSARESVEAGKKIDLKSLPEDMSAHKVKANAAKRKRTISRIKSLLVSEIKRTKSKDRRSSMMAELRKLKSLESKPSIALPSYRIEIQTESVPVVQSDIPEHSMQVNIVGASDVKTGGSSYVEFDLDFPREKQYVGKTKVAKNADWKYKKTFHDVLKFKGGERGMARRDRKILRAKAVFTLWREGGFFSSAVAIGRAFVPLKSFMNKSKIAVKVQMIGMSSRKKIGGTMTIVLRIHEALKGGEMEKVENQHVVIDWSSTAATTKTLSSPLKEKTDTTVETKSTPTTTTTRRASATASNLNMKWIKDPHNIQLIPSYECLKSELIISNKLLEASRKRNADFDTIMLLETRGMVIQGKISIIERDYAAGKLTPSTYLPLLQSAMNRDRQLAVYFKRKGQKNDATRCLRRYKTMAKEIHDLKEKFSS